MRNTQLPNHFPK